ncbi:hypothetical protein D3C80_1741410 [compost metagenome]
MKEFDTGAGLKMWIRGDILNVFDWANYAGYDDFAGGFQDPNENFGEPNTQFFPTRTFKLSLGFNF